MSKTLDSYLIELGIHVAPADVKKIKDFQNAAAQAAKKSSKSFEEFGSILQSVTKTLAISAASFAGGLVAFVVGVTNSLEKVYFAAQRSNTTASQIDSIGRAFQNVGISSDEATASIQSFSQILRTQPGARGYLASLGVRQSKDDAETYLSTLRALRNLEGSMGHGVIAKVGERFGIGEQALSAFERNPEEFESTYRNQLARDRAAGFDAASVEAHKTAEELRNLEADLKRLAATVGTAMMPAVREFASYLTSHMPEITAALKDLAPAIQSIIPAITMLGSVIGFVLKAAGYDPEIEKAKLAAAAAQTGEVGATNTAMKSMTPEQRRQFLIKSAGANPSAFPGLANYSSGIGGIPGSEKTLNIWGNNPGNLRMWNPANPHEVRTRNGVPIGKFEKFGSLQEGLSALAGQLIRYQQHGKTTLTDILNTYAPPNENDTGAYIRDVSGRLHVGANQQLDVIHNPALLQQLMSAIIVHEGNPAISGAQLAAATQARLGAEGLAGGGPAVTQNIKINVTTSDPQKAASLVGGEIKRATGDAIRNGAPRGQ